MKLKRIYVRQLRQFREPLEIDDLGAGLNLFSGPNESGKSSLVRAIRAAFFERHISKSVADLRPWGDSSASPHVELDFSVGDENWRLTKSFLSQKRCDLTIDGQAFSGEEAEDKLADLLGFQMPLRGASKAEQWGIPGLLWIEQGSGQEVRQSVSNAAQHLKSALAASVGEVASSSGDWVTELVKKERAVLLTNTGRPTAEYARAISEQGQLEAQLAELADKVARYQGQVDRLGELRSQQQADAGRPWLEYRQRQAREQEKLKQVEALISEQARDESARQASLDILQVLQQQLRQHKSQAESLAQRRQALQQADAHVQRLEAQTPALQLALAGAEKQLAQTRTELNQARQAEQRRQWQHELERLGPEIAGLQEQLGRAAELQQQLAAMQSRLQQLGFDPQQLQRLQTLHEQHHQLTLQQQSIATRLQFDLLPQQSIDLDNENLQAQGERLLLQPARLTIPGVGQLTIQPGGKDLSELAREQQRLQDDLQAQLQLMQVASLQQAQQQAQEAKSLDDEIRLSRKMLQALLNSGSTGGTASGTASGNAAGGVDSLREQLQSRQQARQLLQEKIERLPTVEEHAAPPALPVAEQNLERAERALREAENAASGHATELKLARQSLQAAQLELQGLQQSLESPQRQQQQRQEQEQAQAQQARALQLSEAIEARAEQIAAAQPQALRDEIQRLGAAADNLETAASQRQAEAGRLQAMLEAVGAQGLEEELAEKQAEKQRLQRRVTELQRRAEALDLLLQLLNTRRQQLTQRLQAPLQKHINHYLQLLFPGASLQVDDNLMPQQLIRTGRRGEEHHDIEALSFGAREQMGLISRLAYADLLKDAGRPTLIILDDALVHSDAPRLEQMKRILFDAARRHQLLLFTCHPNNWRDMGVPREMQALAGSSASASS